MRLGKGGFAEHLERGIHVVLHMREEALGGDAGLQVGVGPRAVAADLIQEIVVGTGVVGHRYTAGTELHSRKGWTHDDAAVRGATGNHIGCMQQQSWVGRARQ